MLYFVLIINSNNLGFLAALSALQSGFLANPWATGKLVNGKSPAKEEDAMVLLAFASSVTSSWKPKNVERRRSSNTVCVALCTHTYYRFLFASDQRYKDSFHRRTNESYRITCAIAGGRAVGRAGVRACGRAGCYG
jgi:hypothetical protein